MVRAVFRSIIAKNGLEYLAYSLFSTLPFLFGNSKLHILRDKLETAPWETNASWKEGGTCGDRRSTPKADGSAGSTTCWKEDYS